MNSNATANLRNDRVKSNVSRCYGSRKSLIARVLLGLMFFSCILPAPDSIVPNRVLAAGGDLVPGFGTNGVQMTDFAGGNDAANAVAPTYDGKIVAAGSATMPITGTDFALAQYDGTGQLDPSFGNGGKVTTDFFGANDGARSLVVQDDGNIVLSGFTTNGGERQFALAGYLANGTLNPAFGQGGKLNFDLGSTADAFKMSVQDDGKLLVVGESRPQNSLDFTILRLNADGSADNSFGNNGIVRVDFGNADRATCLVIDGAKIFVGGVAVKSATDSDFAIAGLNSNGSLNNVFGGDGMVTIDFFGKQDSAQDICIIQDPTIKDSLPILCGGSVTNVTSDFGVAALDRNGNLVTSLFNQGKDTIDLKGGRDLLLDLENQPDGDIVATGWAGVGANFDLGIVKWDGSGTRDLSWASGSLTFDTASGGNNVAFDGLIYQDSIVTAGVGLNPVTGNDDFVLTQHENEKFVEFKKQGPSSPVVQGDIISYTFEITNLTDKEIAFQVQDSLSFLDATFVREQNTGWELAPRGTLERNIVVPAGQTSLFALRVRANSAGTITNNATLLQFASYTLYKGVEYSFVSSDSVETEVTKFAITDVSRDGKNLDVKTNGLPADTSSATQSNTIEANAIQPQAACPAVLFDGVEQKTKFDLDNPSTVLFVKKGYKKLVPRQPVRIRVRLCGGVETDDFIYTRPQ